MTLARFKFKNMETYLKINNNSMKLVTPVSSMDINCDEISIFIQNYLNLSIYIVGVILNISCVLVFYAILFSKKNKMNHQNENSNDIFKILFIKSLNDSLLFIINIFSPLYYCVSCDSKNSLVMQVWNIVLNEYLARVTQLFSLILEILATFDLLLSINGSLKNKFKFFKYKYFNEVIMILTLIFSVGYYFYIFFDFKIVSYTSNGTLIYKTESTDFSITSLKADLVIINAILRDLIAMIILCIFNLLIIQSIQKIIKNKKNILRNIVNDSVMKLVRSKRRTVKMIMISNTINILFHAPICIQNLQLYYALHVTCYREISRTILRVSYMIGFFIYIFFNKIFRNNFMKLISLSRH